MTASAPRDMRLVTAIVLRVRPVASHDCRPIENGRHVTNLSEPTHVRPTRAKQAVFCLFSTAKTRPDKSPAALRIGGVLGRMPATEFSAMFARPLTPERVSGDGVAVRVVGAAEPLNWCLRDQGVLACLLVTEPHPIKASPPRPTSMEMYPTFTSCRSPSRTKCGPVTSRMR